MAELFKQASLGWLQTFSASGKYPIIDKRIFETLADAQAFIDNDKSTAIPGINITVIKDADSKNNGTYFVSEAAGYDGKTKGVLVKLGSGKGVVNVTSFTEAQAEATVDNIGQLVYLVADDSTSTPDTVYKAGLYVITGNATLSKIGTTSITGDIAGDVEALKGQVSTLETNATSHYSNTVLHLPSSIGTNGQILTVEGGKPAWKDKDPEYVLPVAGEAIGGIKKGGDLTISEAGVVTVTGGTNHGHTIAQVEGLEGRLTTIETGVAGAIPTTEKGVGGGVATLDENGKIPVSQLNGSMARVFGIEKAIANAAALPSSGIAVGKRYYTIDTKKIYEKTADGWSEPISPKDDTIYNFRYSDVTGDEKKTNILYRWDGEGLTEISASISLGEVAGTAYEGNKGKANADAITILNSGADVSGSVENKIATKISAEVTRADSAYASKEYEEKVDTNTADITALKAKTVGGADVKLTGYTKPSTGGVIGADDTVNAAIGKLEKAVEDAAAGGVQTVNGQTGNIVIKTGSADGTITVEGGDDVAVAGWDKKADKTSITALSTAVGLDEDLTYTVPTGSNYLTGATSVKDATAKLDAAIKTNADKLADITTLTPTEIEEICKL